MVACRAASTKGKCFAGHKTIRYRSVPGLAIFTLADDHVDPVVSHIQGLPGALDAIPQNSDDFIRQDFTGFLERKLLINDHFFHGPSEIELCHLPLPFSVIFVSRFV
jgi:hypothetical protein